MANKNKNYDLPDYTTTTTCIDEYSKAWKDLAAPVEQLLNVQLMGFDPDFVFSKGNPQVMATTVSLPLWFVRDLGRAMNKKVS